MQKRKNDVKERTTLLLALPDKNQLRFSKYKAAQELWAAILKIFGGNEATKKTKKNMLNQQYGNFKAKGSETLEQTAGHKWLMHTIVWRNRSDLDTMSLDDLYNHLMVYESEVQKKSVSNSQNMAFISLAKNSSGKNDVNTASIPTASTSVSPTSVNIGAGRRFLFKRLMLLDLISRKWNALTATGHFARECMAPRSQDRGRRDNNRQGSKVEEQAPKALMAIDGVGWDWSFMANKEEDHALVVDKEAPIEFALMAKTSAESEVFDNSLCSKNCKKNTESLNSKITDLTDKLYDSKNTLFHYKAGLSQVEGRLIEFKNQEIKFCEKIRVLEFSVECKTNRIENLTNELELLKIEKEGLEVKLTGFQSASKDLDSLLESKRLDKNKKGLGYSVVPPSCSSLFSSQEGFVLDRKFPAGNIKFSTADMGNKGKAGNSQNHIDDKGYWDSGCFWHMTGNISYLTDYEPYDRGRLGHLNFKTMNKLVRHNLVRGLPAKCFENDHNCTACLKGKQHKASCKTKLVNSVTKLLHTLHMDLFGPTSVSSLNHKWYCLVVTDDFSRFTWTFFLKTKDETSGIVRNFITKIENLKELRVKIIRYDNKGEFRNKEMNDFWSRKGIKREFSNARTPQQNEAEAVNTACYVQNRVLVNMSQNKTLYELFNGRSPAIGFLKPFGYHVMILNTLDNLGKFEAKGDEGYFIGNAQDACNADAPESSGISNPTATSTNPPGDHMETLAVETLIPTVSSPVPTACLNDSPEPSSDTRLISKRVTSQDDTPSLDNILTLINRFEDIFGVTTNTDDTIRVEADLGNMETTITASPTPTLRIHKDHPKKPKKIYNALQDPSWVEAMQEELLQFKIQNVWSLVDCPKGDPYFLARVYKVEKAMYGLHQDPRAWYGTLSKYLLTNGFQRGIIDQTLFIRRHGRDFILVQVNVDDIIFGSSNPQLCREFEALMQEKFQMSAMGELNFFLGLQVLQKEDGVEN
nr:hypothetical protein [Tanacetum cinerariifolium]